MSLCLFLLLLPCPSLPLVLSGSDVPFVRRGVPVMHMIPVPFPPVWHDDSDTVDNLDMDSVADLMAIFVAFFKLLPV